MADKDGVRACETRGACAGMSGAAGGCVRPGERRHPVLLHLNMPFYPIARPWTSGRLVEAASVDREAYVAALSREVLSAAPDFGDCRVSAIWVGGEPAGRWRAGDGGCAPGEAGGRAGGGPARAGAFRGGIAAHMADARLGELLRDVRRAFSLDAPAGSGVPAGSVAEQAEVTLTAHPGMVSAATLDACRIGRVTRLWVDYATSSPVEACELGRFMGPEAMDVTRTVLGSSRIDLALRLLAGIPGQTVRSAVASVDAALGYGATAIGLEAFRLDGASALARERAGRGDAWCAHPRRRLPDDSERAAMLAAMEGRLRAEGFVEYLPGEWALPGHESRYLQLGARGCDRLGFGLGARTRFEGVAAANTDDLSVYLRFADDPARCIVERRLLGEGVPSRAPREAAAKRD